MFFLVYFQKRDRAFLVVVVVFFPSSFYTLISVCFFGSLSLFFIATVNKICIFEKKDARRLFPLSLFLTSIEHSSSHNYSLSLVLSFSSK